MALATHNNVASLMQKALDRQTALVRSKFKLKESQVQQIITKFVEENNGAPYAELLKILRDCQLNDDNFTIIFADCTSCIGILGREFNSLIEIICSIEWTHREANLRELYKTFILNLVTAHIYHAPVVISCIVKQFKVASENWDEVPSNEAVTRWSYIHGVIAEIVCFMPMCIKTLMKIIIDEYPYHKAGCYINRAYVHNLLWITKYIPSLQEQIITTVISRLVIIDVNILDNLKRKTSSETIFSMDAKDEDSEIIDTLDCCMVEMLRWLEEERASALQLMCDVFERIILPTHGIRHVQFLLLYTISINQQCADRVLSNLWKIAAGLHGLGPGALATRRTAASHLAGLLARCHRVQNTRLIHYLKNMAEFCHSYITAIQESNSASDNAKVHGAFYAICHAIFYLIAFKHQYLFMSKDSINFVESLNLSRMVTCNLNPLKLCPPQVSRAFAAVTRSHQVLHCQSILERNARQTLNSAEIEKYDEWFPYDPYTLPKSGEKIWPLCIEYKDWLKDGDDETQYSSMKRKRDADDDDYLVPSPRSRLTSSLSNCISPGFKSM